MARSTSFLDAVTVPLHRLPLENLRPVTIALHLLSVLLGWSAIIFLVIPLDFNLGAEIVVAVQTPLLYAFMPYPFP